MNESNKKKLLMAFFDILIMHCAFLAAFLIRFDFSWSAIDKTYLNSWIDYVPFYTCFTLVIYYFFHLYNMVWRYVGVREGMQICAAVACASAFNAAVSVLFGMRLPVSVYCIAFVLTLCGIGALRFSVRLWRMLSMLRQPSTEHTENVMIIGAGEAGRILTAEFIRSEYLNARVCCFIDDNADVLGKYIMGVPIVGNRNDILTAAEKYKIDKIVLAIPSASPEAKRDLLEICKHTTCKLLMVPGIYQLINGDVQISKLREVQIEDLLGRAPICVNLDEIMEYVKNRVILVTGGGGSIGSELCRQIASHRPKTLIIFDIYENNAYDIQLELENKYPDLDLVTLIGSVRDTKRLDAVFEQYRPDVVYHAAAHKHVPLMEDSPLEAIKNNVFGTYNTAKCADMYGVKRFVLISTDKAVNPTNMMGASKRLCEMIVQTMDKNSRTEFVAVRFGNVLGSNGSVIPLFKKWIAEGGPVRVTHPDIIRFFMTIPEAASLVLQAGAYAKGGEIFVLDMGKPVKIDTLARNLIRLSGLTPDVDIKIEYTGLRPGEKMYEEILMDEEGLSATANSLIHIGKPIQLDEKLFWKDLEELRERCRDEKSDIHELVAKMVPTYSPQNEDAVLSH